MADHIYTITHDVAPHTGAWIEICALRLSILLCLVAPHTGAWIEIDIKGFVLSVVHGRSPHGSVD